MIDNSGLTDFTINRIKELRLKNKMEPRRTLIEGWAWPKIYQ